MNIYIAHSKLIPYQEELYRPIREDQTFQEHTFFLPHEESASSSNTRDFYRAMDVVVAECSEVATGMGIELGWAYDDGTPIYCIYKKGSKISMSLKAVTSNFLEYETKEEMLQILHRIVEKESAKKGPVR